MATLSKQPDGRVAVVGMALRFPGADSPEEFWANLVAGKESLVELTEEQLVAAGASASAIGDPHYVRLRPLIRDPELFDAEHFGLTSREAEILNPQHRLFLEACDSALQRAGVDPARTRSIGVFGGGSPNRYIDNVYLDGMSEYVGDMAIEISNQADYLATRVSYLLGLTGPSVTVQTACSTALVAVHHARRALLGGECELALAGGVSIELPYYTGYRWSPNGINSADGHCRAFDRAASGTNFGSGVGVVLLKRLDRALVDGDHVHATIEGSLINNDGAYRSSFAHPGGSGQTELLRRCLAESAVEPAEIGYIEAHGTGTLVGDPVEFSSICTALAQLGYAGGDVPKIPIGSVKTNIGHLGPAAGIAGLLKVLLQVEHGQVVPSLNFEHPNPAIDLENNPLRVATQVAPWPRSGPRTATVSSFGIGGTNAVAVVRGAPAQAPGAIPDVCHNRPRVVPLSAVDGERLPGYAAQVADAVTGVDHAQFPGIVRTLQGRTARGARCAVVAASIDELAQRLRGPQRWHSVAADRRVAWLFPGQGAQFPGMAAAVGDDPVYRAALRTCLEAFADEGLAELSSLVLDLTAEPHEDKGGRLAMTSLAQAALFAVGYAMGRAWQHYADQPAVLIGHSIGEYAAACLAGVMSLSDAVHAVAERGRLMQCMPGGSMLAVMRQLSLVRALIPESLDIAAVNGPESFVVSGPHDEVEVLRRRLELLAVDHSRLRTSHAFHSAMMRPARDAFREMLSGLALKPPALPIVSTVTADLLTADEASSPDYWADQLVLPVRFGDAVVRAAGLAGIFVELGPGATLSTLSAAALGGSAATIAALPRPSPAADHEPAPAGALLPALASYWSAGGEVDWDALDPTPPPREAFPPPPYRRRRYWVDEPEAAELDAARYASASLPLAETAWLPTWRSEAPLASSPAGARGPWLVVHDGLLTSVVDALRARGERVVTVVPKQAAEHDGGHEDGFVIDRTAPDAWRTLCEQLDTASLPPATLVYGQQAANGDLTAGFFDLLHLLQAALERWGDRELVVRAVTLRSQSVAGDEPVDPLGALLHGPASVLPREFPELRGGCVDLAGPPRGAAETRLLVEELNHPEPHAWVALRGRSRWVRTFDHLPVLDLARPEPPAIRTGGVYLVTGGTGAIGVQVLRYLARTPGTRVALLSRGGPRAVGFEDQDLTRPVSGGDTPDALTEALRLATENGVEVMALTGDVSNASSVEEAVAGITGRWGPIAGVFHAAGSPGGELAILRSDESCREVLAPKVQGTVNLLESVHGRVDFVFLFSSIIAVSSEIGMVDYCAANSFLDACALSYSDDRTRVVSVDWCGWSETGMVVNARSAASDALRDAVLGIASRPVRHPLLDRRLTNADRPTYVSVIYPKAGDFLDDHRVRGTRAVSATTLVEILHAAASDLTGGSVELVDVVLGDPVLVDQATELIVVASGTEEGMISWQVAARPHGSRNGSSRVCVVARSTRLEADAPSPLDLADLGERCVAGGWLPTFDDPHSPVEIGTRWRALQEIRVGSGEQLLRLKLGPNTPPGQYTLHPVLLDNASSLGLFLPDVIQPGWSFLPAGFARVRAWQALPAEVTCHVVRRDAAPVDGAMTFDLTLAGAGGVPVAHVEGFRIKVLRPMDGGDGPATPPPDHGVAPPTDLDDVYLDRARYLLSPDEALTLLDALLRQSLADHVVLSRRDPARVDAPRALSAVPAMDAEDPALPPDADEGLTPTEAMVARMWRAALGTRLVMPDDDFYELGGNSLLVIQLLTKIRAEVRAALPGRLLVDNPTVRRFAAAIDELVAAQAASRSPPQ